MGEAIDISEPETILSDVVTDCVILEKKGENASLSDDEQREICFLIVRAYYSVEMLRLLKMLNLLELDEVPDIHSLVPAAFTASGLADDQVGLLSRYGFTRKSYNRIELKLSGLEGYIEIFEDSYSGGSKRLRAKGSFGFKSHVAGVIFSVFLALSPKTPLNIDIDFTISFGNALNDQAQAAVVNESKVAMYDCTIATISIGNIDQNIENAIDLMVERGYSSIEEKRNTISARQICLHKAGFSPGKFDGIRGKDTIAAENAYSTYHGGVEVNWSSRNFIRTLIYNASAHQGFPINP